jgi:hypothetical protein
MLQVQIAEADLKLRVAELQSKTSFWGLIRSPAAAIAAVAFLLPLWLNYLNNRDQQRTEVRKLESDLITKAIYQAHDGEEMKSNLHDLMKLEFIKEQQPAVCQFLRMRNQPENEIFCPTKPANAIDSFWSWLQRKAAP